ncbi:sporulation-specific diadenylate cyclase CdaS [Bacillus sp. JJ722]|uniref:sporulation-specific diadenylate cyclase CdaS n=1 Tax=Bacillus sp. JJ722 TaxID=3122973 RepID=UPI002FFEB862
MNHHNCDFSPMHQALTAGIHQVIATLQSNLEVLENNGNCLLKNFEEVRETFTQLEMTAASFYLNCYLSPFTDKYVDLSTSVQNMSKRKHGGLIVIQREDSLDSLIQSGIPLKATLTHSLLESIFFPGNPLHDGAVLIQENEIVSAAHVLPLSKKLTGEKKMGTRHRAALGLSEQSDALILVVSEETGKITFALGGEFYPINNGTV